MNTKHREVAEYLRSHTDSWHDSRSLKALLADMIPEDKSFRYILQLAYDEGISENLLKSRDINRCVFECQRRLVTDYVINTDAANLAIEFWLAVYDLSNDQILCALSENKFEEEKQEYESLDERYLHEAKFYDLIVDLNEYLSNNDDEKARYEYLSMLFDTLVEPEYIFKDGEAEYIAELCIACIDKIQKNNDIESRYRFLRAMYAKASCLMILGKLKEAYTLFSSITKPIDDLARELKGAGGWADILFRCEVNIHQIKELCGIDDGGFFKEYREEILFFEAHVDQIVFDYQGYYCLPILIPLVRTYRNAFYQVFDGEGKCISAFGHGGQFFALNQAKMSYTGKYTVKYWPINLYSGVTKSQYADWTWVTKEKTIDRRNLEAFIMSNPYRKVDGYLSMLVANNNKRYGRK